MQVTSDVKIGGYCIVVLGQFSFYIEVYTERSS